MEKRIAVAIVSKPHGIRGEVKLKSLGDYPSSLLDLEKVYTSETSRDFLKINKSWQYKNEVCMEIEGLNSREDAEQMRGMYLYIDLSDLPPLQEGQYYLKNLIGCEIQDDEGVKLGKLKEILQHGAADVYVVSGDRNFMMPAIKSIIKSVDIEAKMITSRSAALYFEFFKQSLAAANANV